MQKRSLTALARECLEDARDASSGRSSRTIYGGHEHALRQTLLALTANSGLDEHESPGEATLHVLHGRIRLDAGAESWEASAGDHLDIPAARHSVTALKDSAFLLTVVAR